MLTVLIALNLSLSNPLLDKPEPIKTSQIVPKALTEADNPQHCTDNQWIASEAPFYCIEKSYQDSSSNGLASYPNYSSSGNLYDYHSCTWEVKELKPSLPNNLGNATDWLYNAQAQGMATGSTPRVGAVGWTYGHVTYILAVSGNQVYLAERNWDYQGSYRERWADASSMTYIY